MPVSLASTSASSMHGAVVPIAYATASGSSSSIIFSSIPQVYQDLMLVCYSRSAQAVTQPQFYCFENSDFTTLRSNTILYGNGTSAISARNTGSTAIPSGWTAGASATSGIFGSTEVYWLNYSNTSTYKTSLSRSAGDLNGSGITSLQVKLWPSTSAITSILISNDANNNWSTGSTFALYGVRTVNQ